MSMRETDHPGHSGYPGKVSSHAELLGRFRPRPDAAAKLNGTAAYLTDRVAPGMLHARVLRSPHAHARIVSIDTDAAASMKGVHAVVTARDIPGRNAFGLRKVDQPVLCIDKTRFTGDAVAAVAAETPALAEAALRKILVEYELLPVIDTPEAALAPDAVEIHPGGNLLHEIHYARGDMADAWTRCAHIVEDVYETGRQMHGFMETEGGIVEPEVSGDGSLGLAVFAGSQHPQRDRQALAEILALPAAHIRVTNSPVGGSFGGKDELTVQPIAALLALKTGRPVRLQWTRPESVMVGVKRHPFRIRMRTGCDRDGRLIAHEAELLADTGAYATHGPEVLDAAHEHAQGAYLFEAVRIASRVAYTNNGVAGAFRGFGAVQAQFAVERQIDRLACATGIDPIAFRQRNLPPPEGPGPLGQAIAPSNAPSQVLSVLARHPRWLETAMQHQGMRYRCGQGIALVTRSDGFSHGGPNGGRLQLALAADGRIELRAGLTEMGQGLLPAASSLMAAHLGCDESDTRLVIGCSDMPDAGPTSASRACSLLHRGLLQLAPVWRSRLLHCASNLLGMKADSIVTGHQGIRDAGSGALLLSYAQLAARLEKDALPEMETEVREEPGASPIEAAHHVFGSCAALARVRVDTWTGAVHVEHLLIIAGLGPVISAQGFVGQMEGGAAMGLGMALLEDLPTIQGRYAAQNFDRYLMPTVCDVPPIEVIAVEDLMEGDTAGPRGAGEIGVNVTVPAIANAVANALGRSIVRLPVKPADVLAMMDEEGGK